MPIIKDSDYKAPFWMINEHWETIMPGLLRNPNNLNYTRERIATIDGDFLDLDFVFNNKKRIVILSHGLEGHSDKYYMRGMANQFLNHDWDTLSWNCRSCSETINQTPKLYHHGATEDLGVVIKHIISKGYSQVLLIGFSPGGSLVVKYIGENGGNISNEIVGGIAFSIPCQLGSCAKKLSDPTNRFYLKRFLKKLTTKVKLKATQFPEQYDLNDIDQINSFLEFDTKYSATINGFKDVEGFYKYASAGNYIESIEVPTLLVNSINDTMFPQDCYPYDVARNHKYFYLETPEKGGHLGYWRPGQKISWAEQRANKFASTVMGLS